MEPTSYAVSDSLYLTSVPVSGKEPAKPKEVPTNHLAVIDCSGSMAYDLPKIREQLKKKLPKLLREKDTISIIWFSGRGQFGTLLEAEPVATLTDLKDVEQAIDRWLRPTGMTGFKEPLEEVPNLVARVSKKTPGSVFSLFFMSDGCDNQWPRQDVLKAVEKAGSSVASATFIEYGYYADRPLLTQMAEKSGGALIFAEDFDRYVPAFEAVIQKRQSGAKRVELKIPGDPIAGFAFAIQDKDVLTFAVEAGAVQVPQDLGVVWFLSPVAVGAVGGQPADLVHLSASYAALSLYAQRMKSDVVLGLLKGLGDVRFIKKFSGLFGKQKYSEFVDDARLAAITPSLRLTEGYDPKLVPPDDAFTVLDLLRILSEDDGNRLLLEHEEFKYNRIGRNTLDSSEVLNEEEQKEVDELTAKMAMERNAKKIAEYAARVAAITAGKEALRFDPYPAPDGYSVSNLVYNEDRPNVSVQVRKSGKVDISGRVTAELKDLLPKEVDTAITRNYTIVKDGLVNVKVLPARLTDETVAKLERGLPGIGELAKSGRGDPSFSFLLDLASLPVINRKMVKAVGAAEFFRTCYELTRAQAAQKVYNSYVKELIPSKKAEGLADKYGAPAAAWLDEQGFKDYGFNPKRVVAPATDVYMSKELKVSLKGLSSLPSLKDYRAAVAKGKLNTAAQLMKPTVDEVESFLASDIYSKAAAKEKVLEAWLEGQAKAAKVRARELLHSVSQVTFTIIVGQVWFSDLPTLDDTTMTIDVDGQKVDCSVVMVEKEVRI
jgi:von Willebrand factor type A domain